MHSSNRRIETDRRQRRFATLAPSAHAGRYAAWGIDDTHHSMVCGYANTGELRQRSMGDRVVVTKLRGCMLPCLGLHNSGLSVCALR